MSNTKPMNIPIVKIAQLIGDDYRAATEDMLKKHPEGTEFRAVSDKEVIRYMLKLRTDNSVSDPIDLHQKHTSFTRGNRSTLINEREHFLEWNWEYGYLKLYAHQVQTAPIKPHDHKKMFELVADAVQIEVEGLRWVARKESRPAAIPINEMDGLLHQEKAARAKFLQTTKNLPSRNCRAAFKVWRDAVNNIMPIEIYGDAMMRISLMVNSLHLIIHGSDGFTARLRAQPPVFNEELNHLTKTMVRSLDDNEQIDTDDIRRFSVLTDGGRLIGDLTLVGDLMAWGHCQIAVPQFKDGPNHYRTYPKSRFQHESGIHEVPLGVLDLIPVPTKLLYAEEGDDEENSQ
jgi:hypothetical protein